MVTSGNLNLLIGDLSLSVIVAKRRLQFFFFTPCILNQCGDVIITTQFTYLSIIDLPVCVDPVKPSFLMSG